MLLLGGGRGINSFGKRYSPIYEVYVNNKKKKVKSETYRTSKNIKKCVPIGTETKILFNSGDLEHFYIFRTEKEKLYDYRISFLFIFFGIGSIILFFIK